MTSKARVLADLKVGQEAIIDHIPDETVRVQAIRFGIGSGSTIICDEIIPGGPVILRRHRQQIAVGRNLAKQISIKGVS